MHDHVGCADIQIRHQETMELSAMKQGQGVETDVVSLIPAVKNAAVILRHQCPVRQHGAFGFGLRPAGVGNLHDIFCADLHLRFVIIHRRHLGD